MPKDPAVLLYYQDLLMGTRFFTHAQFGGYLRLLLEQADKGSFSDQTLKNILAPQYDEIWPAVKEKFQTDDNGGYFNVRMREEKGKRAKYSESRRKNRQKKRDVIETPLSYVPHMENENENENENKDLRIKEKVDYRQDPGFMAFTAAHPVKLGNWGSWKEWLEALERPNVTEDQIIAGAKKYAAWVKNGKPKDVQVMMPENWLRKGRWEGEYPLPQHKVEAIKRIETWKTTELEKKKLKNEEAGSPAEAKKALDAVMNLTKNPRGIK